MPQLFNACEYLLDRRLAAGDGPRSALTGPAGDVQLRGAARPGTPNGGVVCGDSGCSPSSGC